MRVIEFSLFHPACHFTDDTVMSVTAADAIVTRCAYRDRVLAYGRRYPYAGYGRGFATLLSHSFPNQTTSLFSSSRA